MGLRIAITGSTGLVGPALTDFLTKEKHDVTQIVRRVPQAPTLPFIIWDPDYGLLDADKLEGFDVIIHLAGANVGERWTKEYKKVILDSRVRGTRLLCQRLTQLKRKPQLLLSASAIGFYGNHPPDVILDEQSPQGDGFLADVCSRWEEETLPASAAGIRVVNLRIGVVLDKNGGALQKMWTPFQMGVGGVLGNGQQMMSWICLDEIPPIITHLIDHTDLSGPVNLTAPRPVSNKEFTKALGMALDCPTFFPVPDFAIRMMFGEMGQRLLLEGNNVIPRKLLDSGYDFKYPHIQEGLLQAVK